MQLVDYHLEIFGVPKLKDRRTKHLEFHKTMEDMTKKYFLEETLVSTKMLWKRIKQENYL